jgi:hypothetical protein
MTYLDTTASSFGDVEGAPAPSFIVGAAMEAERVRALEADVERLSARALRHERDAIDHEHALRAFKNTVASVTAHFDRGCRGGKREFLEELGLELPPRTFTVSAHISFQVELDEDEVYDHTFHEIIDDAFRIDVEVSGIEFEEDDDA